MAKVTGKAGKKKTSALKSGEKVIKGYKTDRGANPFKDTPRKKLVTRKTKLMSKK